jgi:hypothetical protein
VASSPTSSSSPSSGIGLDRSLAAWLSVCIDNGEAVTNRQLQDKARKMANREEPEFKVGALRTYKSRTHLISLHQQPAI